MKGYDQEEAKEFFSAKLGFAAVELAASGYPVTEMEGGFATWKESGYPVEAREAESAAIS